MEEDQNSEVEEVTPQESESNLIDTSETTEENPQVEESHESEDKQERNWRESRRKQRESDHKIQAQQEIIDKLLVARQAPAPIPQVQEPDEFAEIPEGDFLDKGQTRKMTRKDSRTIAREEVQKAQKELEASRFLERLETKYDDFHDVVTPESIKLLEVKQPELAATIADLKDPYKMGLQTYHYLKGNNLSQDVAERRHAKEVEKKIEKNEKTVQSPQTYNKRPMAQAFQSTGENDSKLYEEMMGYARQAGSGY